MDGLPPPNVVDTDFFGIWIEGDCSSEQFDALFFWFRTKIEQLTQFQKKTSAPPLFSDIFKFSTFETFFFGNCVNRSIFVRNQKQGIKLFRRAIPFYPDPQKIGIHHIRGGVARQFMFHLCFIK